MGLYMPKEGQLLVLDTYLTAFPNFQVALLSQAIAAYTIDYSSVWSAVSAAEANFSGYMRFALGTPTAVWNGTGYYVQWNWPTSAVFTYNDGGSPGTPNTIDGWALIDKHNAKIIAIEDITPSVTMQTDGDTINVGVQINSMENLASSPDPAS